MSATHITSATTTQCSGKASKVLIQVNKALTGTITVVDNTAGTTPEVAVITDPTVGSQYQYWSFETGVRVITSATCDITVNCYGGRGTPQHFVRPLYNRGMTAQEKLNLLLKENDLVLSLSPFTLRTLQDGAFLVEKPTIKVNYSQPNKESDEQKG